MRRGFDSHDSSQRGFTNQYVEQQLRVIQERRKNHDWLAQQADHVARVIQHGLHVERLYHQTLKALFAISPYMLTRRDYRRWSDLLCDGLIAAYTLQDAELLAEIYGLLGQSYVVGGEVRSARSAFDAAIARAAEQGSDELMLLAYIGLFKTETFDFSEDFTLEVVATARTLAARLRDPILTAWLYGALANAYSLRGETTPALAYGMTALAHWYQWRNALEIGKAADALATAYYYARLYSHARQVAELAHRYLMQTDNLQYQAINVYQQGIIAYGLAEYEAAEWWLTHAYSLFQRLEWLHHLERTLHSLGAVYAATDRYDEAEALYRKALKIAEHLEDTYERANLRHSLAYLAYQRRNVTEARRDLELAYKACSRLPDMGTRDSLEATIDETRALVDELERTLGAHLG